MTETTTAYPDTRLLIDNEWVDSASGRTLDVLNPATGTPIGKVAHANTADLDRALAATQRGFDVWRKTSAHDRSAVMRKAAGLLRERAETIARLLTQEQGKPLVEAKGEVLAGADIIEWFANEGLRVYGRIVPSRQPERAADGAEGACRPGRGLHAVEFPDQPDRAQARRRAGQRLFVPGEGAGRNAASPAALLACFVDAGIPAGVIGLVFGNPAEISGYLIPHPVIRKVTFTGSTPVGKELAALAGAT